MTYNDRHGQFFGRRTEDGHVAVYHAQDGAPATRLDANVYPVGSSLSARHEHPEGIVLAQSEAVAIGLSVQGRADPSRVAAWIGELIGLSDEPLRRSAQIALSALDEIITTGELADDTPAVAAYEALQEALWSADR